MAILKDHTAGGGAASDYLADLPPGDYDAICVDVLERLGVERQKYESTEMERVDLLAFEFEVAGRSGTPRRVRTQEMRISLHQKARLFQFLSSWLGEVPGNGFDTDGMVGCTARLTLEHAAARCDPSKMYVRVTAVAPEMSGSKGGAA